MGWNTGRRSSSPTGPRRAKPPDRSITIGFNRSGRPSATRTCANLCAMTASPGKGLPYSTTPLTKKLGIKARHRLALLGAPADVDLGELPAGVTVVRRAGGTADVIVSFHTKRRDLERRLA